MSGNQHHEWEEWEIRHLKDETKFDYPVTISLFDQDRYDGEWMPEKLINAIDWLSAFLEKIPLEYRPEATIDIQCVSSYEDSHYQSIAIKYKRPPTDGEIEARKEETAQAKNETRERELSTLKYLKDKYEYGER